MFFYRLFVFGAAAAHGAARTLARNPAEAVAFDHPVLFLSHLPSPSYHHPPRFHSYYFSLFFLLASCRSNFAPYFSSRIK